MTSAHVKGLFIALCSLGVNIESVKHDKEKIVMYISVPKDSTAETKVAGEKLALRVKDLFAHIVPNLTLKYKVRDEVWTQEKYETTNAQSTASMTCSDLW